MRPLPSLYLFNCWLLHPHVKAEMLKISIVLLLGLSGPLSVPVEFATLIKLALAPDHAALQGAS